MGQSVILLISEHNNKIKNVDFVINKEAYSVFLNGAEIIFPKKEFEILCLLASKQTKVFTREEIYTAIWKKVVFSKGNRTIDVHVFEIRRKLNNRFIKTIRGVGYRFLQ